MLSITLAIFEFQLITNGVWDVLCPECYVVCHVLPLTWQCLTSHVIFHLESVLQGLALLATNLLLRILVRAVSNSPHRYSSTLSGWSMNEYLGKPWEGKLWLLGCHTGPVYQDNGFSSSTGSSLCDGDEHGSHTQLNLFPQLHLQQSLPRNCHLV